MTIKGLLYGLAIAVGLILVVRFVLHRDAKVDTGVVSQTLPKEDKSQYIIDAPHHELTEVTRGPDDKEVVKKRFLAPRAKIEVRKDGSVVVTQRVWGFEHALYIGTALDSEFKVRTMLGASAFYWQRWELGGGVSLRVTDVRDVRAYVGGSYNVYGNILITGAVDNHKAVSVGVALKF